MPTRDCEQLKAKENTSVKYELLGQEPVKRCAKIRQLSKSILLNIFPFIRILKDYECRDLYGDVTAGLTVGIMNLSQGMAYGQLANLPPIYGLYVSFVPTLVYFFLGTSRHISIGTFALVSLMVGKIVQRENCDALSSSNGNGSESNFTIPLTPKMDISTLSSLSAMAYNVTIPTYGHADLPSVKSQEVIKCKIAIATAVTMVTGFYQFGLGVLRLGIVSRVLTEPMTRAFITAAALYVLTSQVSHVFGLRLQDASPTPFTLLNNYIYIIEHITSSNPYTVTMCVVTMTIIYVTKNYINPRVEPVIKMPIPVELLMVILGTLVAYVWQFEHVLGVSVVGDIPTGIPTPRSPFTWRLKTVLLDAVGISIVAYVTSLSLALSFAKRHNYDIDPNQELVALGVSNLVSSCFSCYVSAASLSRSLIQESVGGVTQIAGLVSCCIVFIVVIAVGYLFEQLPNNVLAAIIIVNLKGLLLQVYDLPGLWKSQKKVDFCVWLVTFSATILFDVDFGLLIGFCFTYITLMIRYQSLCPCFYKMSSDEDIHVTQPRSAVGVSRHDNQIDLKDLKMDNSDSEENIESS